ncbi:uncharacterized protein LOC144864789 isoform X1 [Branchiostoma floridae x Branchiostoma japonicum]
MDRSSVACPHVIYRDNELMNMQSTRHPTRNVWYGRCPAPVTKGASLHRVHHQLQAKDLSVKRFYGLIGVFKVRRQVTRIWEALNGQPGQRRTAMFMVELVLVRADIARCQVCHHLGDVHIKIGAGVYALLEDLNC